MQDGSRTASRPDRTGLQGGRIVAADRAQDEARRAAAGRETAGVAGQYVGPHGWTRIMAPPGLPMGWNLCRAEPMLGTPGTARNAAERGLGSTGGLRESDFQRSQVALRLSQPLRSEARLASSMSISELVCSRSSTVSCTSRRVSGGWSIHAAEAGSSRPGPEAGHVDGALDLLAFDLVQHRALFFLVQGHKHLLCPRRCGTVAAWPRTRGRHRPAQGSA